MNECKKLIEVALPVKEISAESVRDKSIHYGHLSTLHMWWARRPLPVCRAVVFASLVPDPLDENCPEEFKNVVRELLGPASASKYLSKTLQEYYSPDPYKPYDDIPFTTAIDKMEDNLRNRLLMFIGKFSDIFIANEKKGKTTPAKDQLSDFSLIKWDNKNNGEIITIARKLIWSAHDHVNNTLAEFDQFYGAILKAEDELYNTPDRQNMTPQIVKLEKALQTAIDEFLDRMPKIFDPFAGGGAIPLETARLGCRTFANDLNPVAHIIEKASLEFPQKYGKPIRFSKAEFIRVYGNKEYNKQKENGLDNDDYIEIANRLSFDVEYFAKKLLALAELEIGQYYPADKNGNMPIAYYWTRVAICANPSCKAEVPLLKQFYLVDKSDKKVHLKPVIKENKIDFEIGFGEIKEAGWNNRGNLICPCCGNTTDIKKVKQQFIANKVKEKIIAVIYEGKDNKKYRKPTQEETEVMNKIPKEIEQFRPHDKMEVGNNRNFNTPGWGIDSFGQMFSPRQLILIQTLVEKLALIKPEILELGEEYGKALVTYLGILVDRLVAVQTSFGRWNISRETIEHPFSRQALPMIFDYPESNPFCSSSGSAHNHINWITRYIESEGINNFGTVCNNASSGDKNQFNDKYLSCVITDPPYYDAIAYADLSDFFYVWLKRTLKEIYPLAFAFPQTPKSEECTALKHHHDDSIEKAKEHFEHKLRDIFSSIEKQTKGIIGIMFAHQSTEAWETLCNSILASNMNIISSWAIDTEMGARMIAMDKAALSSSITVTCQPSKKSGTGYFKEIKKDILARIKQEVQLLYRLGFRGADLLTACFGQAVSVFGQFERVEKGDGKEVKVAELLELARDAAFNAIISDIDTDDVTRFYIGWLNLFGFSETDHDDVRRITQIGLNIDVNLLLQDNILLRDGNKECLASLKERLNADAKLGQKKTSYMIDRVHYAMSLFEGKQRKPLLECISLFATTIESPFWRILHSLSEVLPTGILDKKIAIELLANKENLVREAVERKKKEQKFGELGF